MNREPHVPDREEFHRLSESLRAQLEALDAERRRDRPAYRERIAALELLPWVRRVTEFTESPDPPDIEEEAELVRLLADLVDKKSAGLVPEEAEDRSPEAEEEERSEELFRHLMEFSRYREVARELDRKAEEMRRTHPRIPPEIAEWERVLADIDGADLGELVGALERLLSREAEEEIETIPRDRVSVTDCARRIRGIMKTARGRVNFADLFPRGGGRSLFVGTFIALLELIRSGEVTVAQRDRFGDIQVFAVEGEESDAPE